jgi:hypothetical protein
MCRIPQTSISGTEVTVPDLNELRGRFETKLGAEHACDFLFLSKWLQAPVLKEGGQDRGCDMRAEDLALRLCEQGSKSINTGATLRQPLNISQKWEGVTANLQKGHTVIIIAAADQVGGDKSKFEDGMHAVIFLSSGVDNSGENRAEKRFYIVFDPDVYATEASRNLWAKLVTNKGVKNEDVKNLERPRLYEIMRTMILGETPNHFGPLVRKYYPDTGKALKRINRNLVYEK